MKFIWYSPQKCKCPLFLLSCRNGSYKKSNEVILTFAQYSRRHSGFVFSYYVAFQTYYVDNNITAFRYDLAFEDGSTNLLGKNFQTS